MGNVAGNSGVAADLPLDGEAGLKLLDEVVFGRMPGTVGKPKKTLVLDVVRALTSDDIPAIEAGVRGPKTPDLVNIKYSHHQLAQLLAKGLDNREASLITGYSPSYISILKSSPAFEELLDGYLNQRQALFVDVLERMKGLGLATMEELQQRLLDKPEEWTKRELMDMAKLMFGEGAARPQGASAQSNGNGGGVNIEVKFVSGRGPQNGQVIDLEPVR